MKQPYNLNPRTPQKLVGKIGTAAENYVTGKFKTTSRLLDHELGLREMAVRSQLKKGEIKTAGKQQRKGIKTENKQQRKNMTHTVNSAAQLKAKPGTRATLEANRVSFVTPKGEKSGKGKKPKSSTATTAPAKTEKPGAKALPAGSPAPRALPAASTNSAATVAKRVSFADHPNIFQVNSAGTANKVSSSTMRRPARGAAQAQPVRGTIALGPAQGSSTAKSSGTRTAELSRGAHVENPLLGPGASRQPNRSDAAGWEAKLSGQEAAYLAKRTRK
jgi:hypothetical protein